MLLQRGNTGNLVYSLHYVQRNPGRYCMLRICHEQSATKDSDMLITLFVHEETELHKTLVLFGRASARDESFTPLRPITSDAAPLSLTLA